MIKSTIKFLGSVWNFLSDPDGRDKIAMPTPEGYDGPPIYSWDGYTKEVVATESYWVEDTFIDRLLNKLTGRPLTGPIEHRLDVTELFYNGEVVSR